MGLETTGIQDKTGAALYILFSGGALEGQRLEHLLNEVTAQTKHQVLLIDIHSQDGEKVRDFYDVAMEDLPVAIIVRDDDTITNIWKSQEIPSASVISFALNQVSQ